MNEGLSGFLILCRRPRLVTLSCSVGSKSAPGQLGYGDCAEPACPIRPLTGRRLCCQRRIDCLNEYCQAVRHVASSTCVNCCLSPLTLNSSKLTSVGSAESRDASLALNCGSGTVEAGSTSVLSPSSRTGERCH